MGWRDRLPAVPHIHFMAAAPLDGWVRLLLTPGVRIEWRYWPRALVNVGLSACVTVITLPERLVLAPVLWWWGRRSRWRLGGGSSGAPGPSRGVAIDAIEAASGEGDPSGDKHADRRLPSPALSPGGPGEEVGPPILVVLGYYRSGTTHLHNLLACDPANYAPRWVQMLSPQGFVASWFVLKLFLWAVLPTKRPQDDMAFGPEWPGEDDFALSNWTLASPLCGRVVVPGAWEHFRRFHDLEGLTDRERARWRRTQWAILWKLRALARRRRLVIKAPPHTARVGAMLEVLGAGRARFIYLTRDRSAVLASNERLMRAMRGHHLQPPPSDDVVRARIEREMGSTEAAFERDAPSVPPSHLIRMTYDELIAGPVPALKLAYERWGLPWSAQYETALKAYLDSVSAYRSETQKQVGAATPQARSPATTAGHADRALRISSTALLVLGAWMLLSWGTGHRSAIVAMIAGIALGHSATARRGGSAAIGIACALASVAVACLGMLGATWLADFDASGDVAWEVIGPAGWRRFTHESTLLWTTLGALAAFRLGSRRFGVVPGQ